MDEHIMPVEDLCLGKEERQLRKDYLQFTAQDVSLLKELNGLVHQHADAIIDKFYNHLLLFKETSAFIPDEETLKKVKCTQKEYLLMLTGGQYDEDYFKHRLNVGKVHDRIDLRPAWYLGAYCLHHRLLNGNGTMEIQREGGSLTDTIGSVCRSSPACLYEILTGNWQRWDMKMLWLSLSIRETLGKIKWLK